MTSYAKTDRTYAKINLAAIRHNLREVQSQLQDGVKTLGIVKADAYGHGSVAVAKAIADQVEYLCVSTVEEAVTLRENNITAPILVLTYANPDRFAEMVTFDIAATIYSLDDAKKLSAAAEKLQKNAVIHIAVDTGMGRIGFFPTVQSADVIKAIAALPFITVEGIFSHLACADTKDKTDALAQTKRFDDFIELLKEKGVTVPIRHLHNSAGAMELPSQYDMCRVGVALYGLYPSDEMDKNAIKLKPAMEVISHVVHLKQVEKGTPISYGHAYIAPENKVIATVCIGYADGFNRCLGENGYVLIRGQKAPVTGRVCMDQIMVDVTDIPNVTVGDEAVILGKSGDMEITAEELGALSHSFHYEVICNFMPRVTRVYE